MRTPDQPNPHPSPETAPKPPAAAAPVPKEVPEEQRPLSDAERNEMMQLRTAFGAEPLVPPVPGAPSPVPQTPENYERLKALHARARYQADNWHEDGEAVDREGLAVADLTVQALRIIIATVPAAAAANQVLTLLNDAHGRMKAAMTPPPPVPDLPPSPEEVEAERKAEADRKAAA